MGSVVSSTARDNRVRGKFFEEVFQRQALLVGLYPIRNPLACRFAGKGRLQLISSQLDFTLVADQGRVAFLDTKSIDGDSFVYSHMQFNQLKQAIHFNERLVPSGFIVWFLPGNDVYYFTGQTIAYVGRGGRVTKGNGTRLGTMSRFDLRLVFKNFLKSATGEMERQAGYVKD